MLERVCDRQSNIVSGGESLGARLHKTDIIRVLGKHMFVKVVFHLEVNNIHIFQ